MKIKFIAVLCFFLGIAASMEISAQQVSSATGLRYDSLTQGAVPIPPSEQNLQSVTATPYYKVSDEGRILEGVIFDKHGNLLFCDVSGRRVLRLTPDKKISTIVTLNTLHPGGLAFHKDGRLFIAALDLEHNVGAIIAVNPDGSGMKNIIAPEAGYMPNDLVFDDKGGFYFTDFKGNSTEPNGGVYYASPDMTSIKVVLPHLAMANGIVLSADGKELWVTEFGRNLLHRVLLSDATTIAPIGTAIAYHFTGPAPDSMRSDADGNLYVALYSQGRILIFNRSGIPIGQVLFPEREKGHYLLGTSLAIRPGTNELYAVTSDGENGKGATIFQAKVFAKGIFR
ncbi:MULTISPECIES: SMP-30/gluconolactonase/LRE family protein [Bacteroidota]|uniref:SMP-30/gluconolactonase/LRE family protein n=1 Tax=Bacteroidota TaxID=976 RepID=UPI002FD98C0E